MARLKVLYPGNHTSSGNIGADVENIVRYINSAEVGDFTLAELIKVLFDEAGVLKAPVELRNDPTSGLQYRVGTYTDSTTGWQSLATTAELRGTSGVDVGTIGAPIFNGRQDFTATSGQTAFSYAHDSADAILLYLNGALQATSAFSTNSVANTVTLGAGATTGDAISIFKVQGANTSGFSRTDTISLANQAVFPYVHTADQSIMIYRNGVIQRSGSSNDYTTSPSQSTVTFTTALSAGDVITFLRVEDTTQVKVSGLMTEDTYTNTSGLIPYNKLAVTDNEIPQTKVSNLTTLLANRGRMYVSATAPSSPNAGDMWVDTSTSPNVLKFYNGTGFLLTSPDTGIPAFSTTNALQFLRVNSTGGGLEFSDVDVTALVPKTYIGAADGVAGLDSTGKLPIAQLPDTFATRSFFFQKQGSIADGSYVITRAYKQNVRIDAIAVKATSGSANVQLRVNNILAGDVIAASSSLTEQNLSASIAIDAVTTSKEIAFTVSSASGLTDIEVTLAAVITNV